MSGFTRIIFKLNKTIKAMVNCNMIVEKIKEKIRLLELEWKKETNNDNLIYLNGQLSAWHEILRNYEKN